MGLLKSWRHECFVREYLVDENASEAYRRVARRFSGNPTDNSARVIACKIMRRPEVQRRVKELRNIMVKKADITLDKIIGNLEEAVTMARVQAKPNDMVTAAMAQAKIMGLLKDQIVTGTAAEFEKLESISQLLEKVAADAGPEAALGLAQALNIKPEEEAPEEQQLAEAIPPTDSVN